MRLLAFAVVLLAVTAAVRPAAAGHITLPYVWVESMPDVAELNTSFAEVDSEVDDNDARLDAILSTDTCTSPPCDLTPGTTMGGLPIGTGGGEANTASNLGGGLANFSVKTLLDLQFNSFSSADFDLGANLITIDPTKWLTIAAGNAAYDPLGAAKTFLDQAVGETDLRYDATRNAYYYDTNGGGTRSVDGTDPYLDYMVVEVPRDYATIQAALDSEDCKEGTDSGGANQGCAIRFEGRLSEKIVIGNAADTTQANYSVIIEGKGTMGFEVPTNRSLCAATLEGDGTLNGNVITVDDSIGVILRNFCIDMDAATANDPKYGILVGGDGASDTLAKHVVIEGVSIFGAGAVNGAGIKWGNSAVGASPNSDTAHNTIRNVYMDGVQTCVEVDAQQAVGNSIDRLNCANPTSAIGGIKLVRGQIDLVEGMYYSTGATNQTAINVLNNSLGISIFSAGTFEVDEEGYTLFNYDDSDGTGNMKAQTIIGTRFQIQTPGASGNKRCINWDRAGTLNVIGNSFESDAGAPTCVVDARNADTVAESYLNWSGNDIEWGGTEPQPDMVINESTAGGPMIVTRDEQGTRTVGQTGTIVYEGATLDGFETTVAVTDPTADRTVTLPNANSNTVIPATCGGTDKVSAISSAGVVTCSADSGGGGGAGYADVAAASLAGF